MPEIVFIRKERAKLADEQRMTRGAPDLVVEVISPTSGSHDRVRKLNWYASIGVGEYWLADPSARTIERFVLGGDGRYAVTGSASGNDIFSPASFVGLAIPLGELWLVPGEEE